MNAAGLGEVYRICLRRCTCDYCRALDKRHPDEGFQLALFPYSKGTREGGLCEGPADGA